MRRSMFAGRVAAAFLLASIAVTSARPGLAAEPIRTLILSGQGDPDVSKATTEGLRRHLEASGRFDVKACDVPIRLTLATLGGFDLVIDNGAGVSSNGEAGKSLARFVGSGRGLIVLPEAVATSPSVPDLWPIDRPDIRPAGPPRFVDLAFLAPDHPIAAPWKGKPAPRLADATTPGIAPAEGAEVVAEVVDRAARSRGPAVVVRASGGGRVVALNLGHDASAIHEPDFGTLLARSGEWAARGRILDEAEWRLEADFEAGEPARARPVVAPIRALVVLGDSGHDAALEAMLLGDPDLADRLPVEPASKALAGDLRERCDVLIVAGLPVDLAEAARKALRDHVEAGGGVVALPQGLEDGRGWPWWLAEGVGGAVAAEPKPAEPKPAGDLFLTPTGAHPIVEGIAPFHVVGEPGARVGPGPGARPLLVASNPGGEPSASAAAWVGPGERSRVVSLSVGRGRPAFGHPSYRSLVRNAIRWAAGRPGPPKVDAFLR